MIIVGCAERRLREKGPIYNSKHKAFDIHRVV
jgi:hypothetical protein